MHPIKIFARKCVIKDGISKIEEEYFIDNNHKQGYIPSSIQIGLYYSDKLVFIITFGKPRFNKNYEYEIIRLCTDKNKIVVGGASKCFAYFINKYKPKNVISYCDKSVHTGEVYEYMGLTYSHTSKPNYWWVKDDIKLNRVACQKHKLHNILKDEFNLSESESQNMIRCGYSKVSDEGNLVFIYE